jgi:hypothetical protein
VHAGDSIWWDYRDWSAAISVPAVVGSWPEPFAQESQAIPVECAGTAGPCRAVVRRLDEAGGKGRLARSDKAAAAVPQVLVGPWTAVRRDPAVDSLEGGPASTGIYATFKGPIHGGWHLIGLDPNGDPARDLGTGAGLVAALAPDRDRPIWIVTGSGNAAVRRAAAALTVRSLENHYAIAATGHAIVPLPISGRVGQG